MNKEINARQMICLYIICSLGNTILFLGNQGHHVLLSLLTGFLAYLPVIFIYNALLKKYPGMTFHEIIQNRFGKGIGVILNLLYFILALYLAGRISYNYIDFISSMVYDRVQSQFLFRISFFLVIFLFLKHGLNSIARFSQMDFYLSFLGVIGFLSLGYQELNFENLLPILPYYTSEYLFNSCHFFIYPFCECFFLYNMICKIKDQNKRKKVFFLGSGIAFLFLAIFSIRIISRLGIEFTQKLIYPVYSSLSLIHYKNFISGIEVVSIIIYFLATILKVVVCIYSAQSILETTTKTKGENYRYPLTLIVFLLSVFLFKNNTEMESAKRIYMVLSAFFFVGIPFVVFLFPKKKNKLKLIQENQTG